MMYIAAYLIIYYMIRYVAMYILQCRFPLLKLENQRVEINMIIK